MRQAILAFDEETVAEWGFGPFLKAGLRDAEVLSCEGSRGVTRLHVDERVDPDRLDDLDVVEWWELVEAGDSEYVYVVEACAEGADVPGLDADRLPRTERVSVQEGAFASTSVGSQERLREMVARLEATGVDATLERLGGYRVETTPLDGLTDRQREVLEVAYERGYYDVPRAATTDDVASDLGLHDSTVAEHLQRAERNLVGAVLGRDD
jgi:predicted DNA binding protein